MTKRLCNVPQMSVYLYSYSFALVALLILDVLRTKSHGAFTVCDKYCISDVETVVLYHTAGRIMLKRLTCVIQLQNHFNHCSDQSQMVSRSINQHMSRHIALSPEQCMLGCMTSPFP